jgi:hypothetical protein
MQADGAAANPHLRLEAMAHITKSWLNVLDNLVGSSRLTALPPCGGRDRLPGETALVIW